MYKIIFATQYIITSSMFLPSCTYNTILSSLLLHFYKHCISCFMVFQRKVVDAMIVFTTYTLFVTTWLVI